MIINLFIALQKKIVKSKPKQLLEKIGLYSHIKNTYRALIICIGKNGLKLKIRNTSAKIIVSNPNELSFYNSLDNEKAFLEEFLSKINRQTIFYDVGAHIGLYSLAAATYKIPPKFIYCWEPEPHNFKRLKENIKLNKINNIEVFPIASGSENTMIGISTKAKEPGSLTPSLARKGSESISVQVVKGDDWILKKKLHLPSIIKIDVEGYEFNVLNGLKETIKKSHPIIFLEVHPAYLKDLGFDKEHILNFLKNLNYKITPFSLAKRKEEHYICEL